MIQVIHIAKVASGKMPEARDWAKRMAACAGATASEPLTGRTGRIVFSKTHDSMGAYEEFLNNLSPEYKALQQENREKRLVQDIERYVHRAIE